MTLPTDSKERKDIPLAAGCLFYFPDALAEVAKLSKKGNDKHNPGEPLHWSRGKSNDHADCIARHLVDAGPKQDAVDPEDGELHATKTAWRALANLQVVLEARRSAQKESIGKFERPDDAGWIPWHGRGKPDCETVQVRFRNGQEYRTGQPAGMYDWYHLGDASDIVAYRPA